MKKKMRTRGQTGFWAKFEADQKKKKTNEKGNRAHNVQKTNKKRWAGWETTPGEKDAIKIRGAKLTVKQKYVAYRPPSYQKSRRDRSVNYV